MKIVFCVVLCVCVCMCMLVLCVCLYVYACVVRVSVCACLCCVCVSVCVCLCCVCVSVCVCLCCVCVSVCVCLCCVCVCMCMLVLCVCMCMLVLCVCTYFLDNFLTFGGFNVDSHTLKREKTITGEDKRRSGGIRHHAQQTMRTSSRLQCNELMAACTQPSCMHKHTHTEDRLYTLQIAPHCNVSQGWMWKLQNRGSGLLDTQMQVCLSNQGKNCLSKLVAERVVGLLWQRGPHGNSTQGIRTCWLQAVKREFTTVIAWTVIRSAQLQSIQNNTKQSTVLVHTYVCQCPLDS